MVRRILSSSTSWSGTQSAEYLHFASSFVLAVLISRTLRTPTRSSSFIDRLITWHAFCVLLGSEIWWLWSSITAGNWPTNDILDTKKTKQNKSKKNAKKPVNWSSLVVKREEDFTHPVWTVEQWTSLNPLRKVLTQTFKSEIWSSRVQCHAEDSGFCLCMTLRKTQMRINFVKKSFSLAPFDSL